MNEWMNESHLLLQISNLSQNGSRVLDGLDQLITVLWRKYDMWRTSEDPQVKLNNMKESERTSWRTSWRAAKYL